MFKGLVVALVTILLIWAPHLAGLGDKITETSNIVFGTIMPVVAGLWIRGSVTPVNRGKHVREN